MTETTDGPDVVELPDLHTAAGLRALAELAARIRRLTEGIDTRGCFDAELVFAGVPGAAGWLAAHAEHAAGLMERLDAGQPPRPRPSRRPELPPPTTVALGRPPGRFGRGTALERTAW